MTKKTVLDGNAKTVLAAIKGSSKADLEGLLEAELAGAKRATVIKAIKAGMKAHDVAASAKLAQAAAAAAPPPDKPTAKPAAAHDPGAAVTPAPVIENVGGEPEDLVLLAFSRETPRQADVTGVAKSGSAVIVFGDGESEIGALARVSASAEDFAVAGDKAMYRRPIVFAGHAKRSTINVVALVDGGGNVVSVIDVSRPGLDVGAGINAEYPAGSLIF